MIHLLRWSAILSLAGTTTGCATMQPTAPPSLDARAVAGPTGEDPWSTFWRSRGVSPAPPRDFLDSTPGRVPEILNLTGGAISDENARGWVVADLRRGRGDGWAFRHLRLDMANADVFGPPGLNGTGRGILDRRSQGVIEIRSTSRSELVAGAAIVVPPSVKSSAPELGLTNFVIVLVFRATGQSSELIYKDGRREVLPAGRKAGDLSWQLDTGELRESPVVGPLWYQARGWSCNPEGSGVADAICALVRPTASVSSGKQR